MPSDTTNPGLDPSDARLIEDNHPSPDSSPSTQEVQPLALSAKQAARLLGIGTRTLWRMTNASEVPHARIGRRVVYPVRELDAWLNARVEGGEL